MPGGSATSGMPARSHMNTTARSVPPQFGLAAAIAGANVVSANSSTSAASRRMKAMSSPDRRGFTVWQIAPMPEIA